MNGRLKKSVKLSACGKGNLIPNLPNELALLCLARVPRQHHHTLSEVSKPIRAAVSSPEFFETRSLLGLSEEVLYISLRSPFQSSAVWFSLHRSHDGDQPVRVPVPPHPRAGLNGSGSVALGNKIYVFGGWTKDRGDAAVVNSPQVWVLDCRSNSWSRGPDMLAPRRNALAAVLDGRIYVVGGVGSFPFAEVLEEGGQRWEALPEPPGAAEIKLPPHSVVAHGGAIRVWVEAVESVELRFEVARGRWDEEAVEVGREERLYMGNKWVAGGRLFVHHRGQEGGVKRFDEAAREWKKVEGVRGRLPWGYWAGPKVVGLSRGGQMVAMTGIGAGELYGFEDSLPPSRWNTKTREAERGTFFDVWCTHIDAASGTVTRSEKVFSQLSQELPPEGVPLYGYGIYFTDWNLFDVYL